MPALQRGRPHPLLRVAALGCLVLACAVLSPAQAKTPSAQAFERLAAQAAQARDANELDRAQTLYRKALAMRRGWAEGWWSLGTILYERDKYDEAARAFARVVALQPKHGSAHAMLGLCEFELGRDAEALRDIQKGRHLGILEDPQLRRVVLFHEGTLLLRQGSFENAQQTLDLVAAEGPASDELQGALGMAVLRVHPVNLPPEGSSGREIVVRAGRAESLAALKKPEEARQEYSKLAQEHAETANVHYAFGRFLLETHDIDMAVAEFQREIENNPKHVLARLEIAAVRYRIDSADGVKYAQEAVKLDPGGAFGHYLLGLLYLDTGDFAGSITQLEIAQRLSPQFPSVYFALGNAYARAGRKPEAARARATFTRLSAQSREQTSTVYGGKAPGVTREEVRTPKGEPR